MEVVLNSSHSFLQLGKRKNQEDARFPNKDEISFTQSFFVVCDGVGGCDRGELASRTVCDAIASAMSGFSSEHSFSVNDFETVLQYAYKKLGKAEKNENRSMATTLTFLCFHSGGCLAAHIGDSRIYHIRPGYGIMYQSSDHSLINALVHSGFITPEEAEHHPEKNVITRSMNAFNPEQEQAQATVLQIKDIEAGDYFFLCTDGVTEVLSNRCLEEIVGKDIPDREKMEQISYICNDSKDNNTAFLIPVHQVYPSKKEDGDETGDVPIQNETWLISPENAGERQTITDTKYKTNAPGNSIVANILRKILKKQ